MGNESSKVPSQRVLTYTDLVEEMKPRLEQLTERDRNLFDFAVTAVSRESKKMKLESVRICINFLDTYPTCIKSEDNPKNGFVVSYDGSGGFSGEWETESTKRYVFRILSTSISDFFSWLGELVKAVAPAIAGASIKAIKF